ncbi:MAG: cobalt-precorrin-5B (C(1))-methyltransferase [Epsilonproteobacteria bacterium]|nr:cobalt-precorrin-5B (C(1))-methyltransferase [Campylobacterota bacterium]
MSLKKGYTTGVHAAFAFKSALFVYLSTSLKTISISKKMDNDDLDVTKGCEIVVEISSTLKDLTLNPLKHRPQIIKSSSNTLYLFAGKGVGVVTKRGLKIPPSFPAVNPAPLKAIENIFINLTKNRNNLKIFASIGVIDGERIAKDTANEKVGVLGGISILGESGFVNPVSANAYIDSIKEEMRVAFFHKRRVVFTIGKTSFEMALRSYEKEEIVEIGNFVYDALKMAKSMGFKKIVLIAGVGKITKIAQGKKNTHNRFGNIDFESLKKEFEIAEDIVTVKRMVEILGKRREEFYTKMVEKAKERVFEWIGERIDILISNR